MIELLRNFPDSNLSEELQIELINDWGLLLSYISESSTQIIDTDFVDYDPLSFYQLEQKINDERYVLDDPDLCFIRPLGNHDLETVLTVVWEINRIKTGDLIERKSQKSANSQIRSGKLKTIINKYNLLLNEVLNIQFDNLLTLYEYLVKRERVIEFLAHDLRDHIGNGQSLNSPSDIVISSGDNLHHNIIGALSVSELMSFSFMDNFDPSVKEKLLNELIQTLPERLVQKIEFLKSKRDITNFSVEENDLILEMFKNENRMQVFRYQLAKASHYYNLLKIKIADGKINGNQLSILKAEEAKMRIEIGLLNQKFQQSPEHFNSHKFYDESYIPENLLLP